MSRSRSPIRSDGSDAGPIGSHGSARDACRRISWEHLFDFRSGCNVLLTCVLDFIVQRVAEIRSSGNVPYVGVTEHPLRRFHYMHPLPSHFPDNYRSMDVIASGNGRDIASLESQALQRCREERLQLGKYPVSRGGERVDRNASLRYLYVCNTGWEGVYTCRPCPEFTARLFNDDESQPTSSFW